MNNINKLSEEIAEVLSLEKAYDLPLVCLRYGLESGTEAEAYSSKRVYVRKRLKAKDFTFLLDIAKKIINDYGQDALRLSELLYKQNSNELLNISEITRQNILEWLYSKGNIEGKIELIDFLSRLWNLENMVSNDYRFLNAREEIWQHKINNFDWDDKYLFENYLKLNLMSDEFFINFLELVVHPVIRKNNELDEYVKYINKYLSLDGYSLKILDSISNHPIYKITKVDLNVKGFAKNLIFAAKGPKPQIVISDFINNDIKIIKNESNCLIYDRTLLNKGLLWKDLVDWWNDRTGNELSELENERALYRRLFDSLDSNPEKILFKNYYKAFKNLLADELPALIPQVYLHYDPYTLSQRNNLKVLSRQRMDFLLLLPNHRRIVIEIDGKHHYSVGDKSNPRLYADMVKEDRDLKLLGYEVYRFGGHEFINEKLIEELLFDFFYKLFLKHGLEVN